KFRYTAAQYLTSLLGSVFVFVEAVDGVFDTVIKFKSNTIEYWDDLDDLYNGETAIGNFAEASNQGSGIAVEVVESESIKESVNKPVIPDSPPLNSTPMSVVESEPSIP
ncbi:hypothetical protein HK098_007334, partial [Nowakowskiella sp. JEL0407]